MLLTSNVRIGDIARQCGFSDADYVSRRFRQQIGVTPRKFRQGVAAPDAGA